MPDTENHKLIEDAIDLVIDFVIAHQVDALSHSYDAVLVVLNCLRNQNDNING